MPRGFMDDLEGEIIYEKLHEGGLGEYIFSADLDGEDALLPNIRYDCVRRISDDLCRFVGGEEVHEGGLEICTRYWKATPQKPLIYKGFLHFYNLIFYSVLSCCSLLFPRTDF